MTQHSPEITGDKNCYRSQCRGDGALRKVTPGFATGGYFLSEALALLTPTPILKSQSSQTFANGNNMTIKKSDVKYARCVLYTCNAPVTHDYYVGGIKVASIRPVGDHFVVTLPGTEAELDSLHRAQLFIKKQLKGKPDELDIAS